MRGVAETLVVVLLLRGVLLCGSVKAAVLLLSGEDGTGARSSIL